MEANHPTAMASRISNTPDPAIRRSSSVAPIEGGCVEVRYAIAKQNIAVSSNVATICAALGRFANLASGLGREPILNREDASR